MYWLISWFWVITLSLVCSQTADAKPSLSFPEVSLGTNPYRAYGGTFSEPGTQTILTVPTGQEFIVTMVRTSLRGAPTDSLGEVSPYGFQVKVDGSVAVQGGMLGTEGIVTISSGKGKLMVPSSSTLSITYLGGTSFEQGYYLQGYFVQEGSKYRSTYGVTPTATGLHTIYSVDADRDFLVRTLVTQGLSGGTYRCDVYVDGVLMIPRGTTATTDMEYIFDGPGSAFVTGDGALPLQGGSNLQILPNGGSLCEYYMEGEYIHQ